MLGTYILSPVPGLSSARKHSEVQYFYYSAIVVLHLGIVKRNTQTGVVYVTRYAKVTAQQVHTIAQTVVPCLVVLDITALPDLKRP